MSDEYDDGSGLLSGEIGIVDPDEGIDPLPWREYLVKRIAAHERELPKCVPYSADHAATHRELAELRRLLTIAGG